MRPSISRLALLVVGASLLAACGPPSTPYPMEQTVATPEQRAQGSEALAGTYRLEAVHGRYLPAEAGITGGCPVAVHDGALTLSGTGRYTLELTARSLCDDAQHSITKEGLYRIQGFEIRFGDRFALTTDQPAPETSTGPEEFHDALFPYGLFSGRGTFRGPSLLTVTTDDLVPYAFVRG